MTFDALYSTLSAAHYAVFSFEDVCAFYPAERRATVQQALSRWKHDNLITSLRKGLYELSYPAPRAIPDMYLANRIYAPSYVSLETALSHYSIIPEVSMAVTSITSKPTRRFRNSHGLFWYRTVKPKAFTGYRVERHGEHDVYIAEPEKALVDYLYFKTLKGRAFDPEAERIDMRRVERLNKARIALHGNLYGINAQRILYAHP